MTFAGQTAEDAAKTMLSAFVASPLSKQDPQIDSARMYCGGKTEELIGKILTEDTSLLNQVSLATKAHPFMGESLAADAVQRQCDASLAALQGVPVDIFYLHAPDANCVVEETLTKVQEMYEAGKFKRFALSNYTAWETVWIHNFMSSKGWVVPCIYQGMMNGITRKTNEELIPALRRLNMSFYAYNPLAGGMLTGKHTRGAGGGDGRFNGETPWGKIYQQRFMQEKQFEAMDLILAACKANGDIPPAEAALRWMKHHSGLTEEAGDAIIIGASKIHHFEANMNALSKGPLPAEVLTAYDQGWELCRAVCPSFSRGYSGSTSMHTMHTTN
jgi:aflatoxin B1 aldehyde reductase